MVKALYMKLPAILNKLLDVDGPTDGQFNSPDNFLVREGNLVHRFLIYIEMIYGLFFSFLTWYQGYTHQSVLNACLFTFSTTAFLIQYKGFPFRAKIFNLSQLIIILALMFYYPSSPYGVHINDSVLVFYIPVSVGTLIAFQGKERKYGYIFSCIILLVALLLILTDLHHPSGLPEARLNGISYDLLYNVIGAAVATFTEVAYILAVNNRLNGSLIKANQELDNFVYIVSHDLRSPLMLTKGLLDISKRKIDNKEDVLKYMSLAGKSIENLDEIIKEILAYSRNSRTGLQYEQFDLKVLIRDIRDGIDLTACPDFAIIEEYETDTIIRTDKGRLHTILRNLITNGFKYRNKNTHQPFVKIHYSRSGNRFSIVIEDNGQGIADESLGKVYDMFYRGTSSAPGTGLGLYICKEMLQKMGAAFLLESSLGKGTRFTISLQESVPDSAGSNLPDQATSPN